MKMKIISAVLVAILLLSMIGGFSYGANYGNKFVSISVPDSIKKYYSNVTNDSAWESFSRYSNNVSTYVHYDVYKHYSAKASYTQSDLDTLVKNYQEYAKKSGDTVTIITKKMVEINGCKGIRFAYKHYYKTSGTTWYADEYLLLSDNYEYNLEFKSTSSSFIDSSEHKSILKSFKIKDTVKKSKGLPFTDVSKNDWSYSAIKYVYDKGYIKGTNAYTFSQKQKVTRGMLVTILYRMENSPKVSGKPKFSDVQDSKQYYYNAVKWATDKKIVSGYKNGKFGPNDNITREQLAVILNKYAQYKKKNLSATNNLKGFKDANRVSNYAIKQMKWAVGAGVITGNKDKTLKPQGTATRAEVASMLYKFCTKVK